MFTLKNQKVLITPQGRFYKGKKYEEVPASIRHYFNTDVVVVVDAENVEKVMVPVYGDMTEKQLNEMKKDYLTILLIQYDIKVEARMTNDEMVKAILVAQEAKNADPEGDK